MVSRAESDGSDCTAAGQTWTRSPRLAALSQPGQLLLGPMRSADDAQKKLFQRQLPAGGWTAVPRGGRSLSFNARAQFFERTLGDQPSLMNDRNVAAQALDDFENMRGEKNRGSAGVHALQHGLQGAGGDRVHAFEGLVEKQDLGSMNHGRCQRELLLHAVGVVGDELFGLVRELHEIEQLGGAPGGGYPVEAIHSSGETEELSTGETSEQSN